MSVEKTHLSDSDESDEDFCPEKAALAGDFDAASEDDSEEEDDATANVSKRNTRKAKTKRNSKKTKKVKKPSSGDVDDEDDTDEDSLDEEEVQSSPLAQTVPRRKTRQTEAGHEKVTLEKEKLESEDEDKTRTEALWADFLSDVKQPPKATPIAKTATSTAAISKEKEPSGERKAKSEDDRPEQKTNPTPSTKLNTSAILDSLSRDSVKENKELKLAVGPAAAAAVKLIAQKSPVLKRPAVCGSVGGAGGGLGSILHQIGKKKKISVLEKSQSDWSSFKQDEGIDEELQTFNKGKDGYLERQDFLQRTDLRQFEIEKNLRQSRRNN